jgi:hypothetical protein
MDQVNTFDFEGTPFNVLVRDGELRFAALEAGKIIGLKGNGHDLTKHLDEDESEAIISRLRSKNGRVQERSVVCVNESGEHRPPTGAFFWELLTSLRSAGRSRGMPIAKPYAKRRKSRGPAYGFRRPPAEKCRDFEPSEVNDVVPFFLP